MSDEHGRPTGRREGSNVSDLYDQLRALEAVADTPEQRERARRARQSAADLQPQPFGNVVAGFDRADLAEASLGALVFGVPLFMDDTTVALGQVAAAGLPTAIGAALGDILPGS